MSCVVAPGRRIPSHTVGSSEDVNTSSEIFIPHQDHKEPLPFLLPLPRLHSSLQTPASPPSDRAYLQAAAIFRRLRTEKPAARQLLHYGKREADTPPPESGADAAHRRAYQLAFDTLKYQDLLEDMIADSCFHTSQHIDRRFLSRQRSTKEGEEPLQEVRDLEHSLQRCKTKLAASLARCRVKQNLQSVSCFLSDAVRTKQHRAKCLPLYAWVNTLKTSVEEMCEALRGAGLREVELLTDLREEAAFCRDPLCPDTLVFSRQLQALLRHGGLTSTHTLNTQDRSLCVAVSALRPLLFDKGDVLVAGSFSAATVAHVSVAAAARCGRALVCGADHTAARLEEMQELLARMDITNVRVLSEAFCGLDEWDAAVQRLKVIMVLPQCSSSALSDPVSAIHSEHGDWDLLPDLCLPSVSRSKIHQMAHQQARLLAHALSFTKVQTVVYCTRSVYAEENQQLVKRVLEKAHTHPKLLPFRVNGPIFPHGARSGDPADSKFFRLEASQFTNGCFVARLSRQADPTKVETVHDVLARAAAKGLLGGIIPEQSKTAKRGKSRKNRAVSAGSKPSSPPSRERPTGSEVTDGEETGAASEREEKRGACGEEGEEGEEGGKKTTGQKGGKRKVKGQTNRTTEVSKQNPKSRTKKSTKTKVNQAHHKRRLPRSKPRRIPRLTLTLMSSAKPSNHLSPITALAHKLSNSPTVQSQQDDVRAPPPARPAPHAAPKQAESTRKDGGKVVRPRKEEKALKAADFVLPPISSSSSPSSGSASSRSETSPGHRASRTSRSQPAQTSASPSSGDPPGS